MKVNKAKIRNKWKNVAGKVLNDYVSKTSIHGFRYLVEGKRINGVFWFIALVFSIVGCVALINQTYGKWNDSPVIVSFAQKSTPLWAIPLPAVTICPEIKYKRSLFNLTIYKNTFNVTNQTLINYQNALFPICPESYPIATNIETDFAATLRSLAVPHHEVFALVDWRGAEYVYSKKFKEILTDDGICYTFNMLDYKDIVNDVIDDSLKYPKMNMNSTFWSLQDGYSNFSDKVYPFRALGSGLKAGLEFRLLALKEDLEYVCKGAVQGFKLALHSPADWPRFRKQFYRIPLKKEVIMTVKPKVMETASNLRKYKPNIRQCYFEGEKKLKFFKIYTESNCKLECLANYTVERCGCTQFGYPHDNTTKVCNYKTNICAKNSFIQWVIDTWNPKNNVSECNCLPSCNSIAYDAEVSYGEYYYNEFLEAVESQFDDKSTSSFVNIYFKEDDFISVTRSELFGVVDFLSNCGGLLGLFMGISILSMVEFVYYFSLRWACVIKEKSEPEEVTSESVKDDDTNIIMVKEFDKCLATVSGNIVLHEL